VKNRRENNLFLRELLNWYRGHNRKLPWRETSDPYKIWVSEVMLQQTTVPAVFSYYEKWFKLFPDVQTLALARSQKVLKAWEGLGYYQRARNLHRAAKVISEKHAGYVPQNYEDLIALPGFGPYTAAAVLSIAYGRPYPALDANVRRVLLRLAGIKKQRSSQSERELLRDLTAFMPKTNPGEFNQAMMELGALVCKPRNPLCLLCPWQRFCLAYKNGEQEIIPAPQKRRYQKIEAVVGVIKESGKYLIQKRPAKGLLAGLWEFPGGKRKDGETPEVALRRELREELGVEVKAVKFLLKIQHAYTQFEVTLYAYECALQNKPSLQGNSHRCVSLRALKRYPFPSGSAKIVRFLEERDRLAAGAGRVLRKV
jgi:A/G-specific adenine glycosylase